ncbi:MAG: glycine--tRNA ligase subunit beta, partial [Spirochaetes bacterium]|nr:glycine--tRNA ligase subunit beta [Spirochaetota bacterium]
MNNEFILEIGTEELPARFLIQLNDQIEKIISDHLEQNRTTYTGLEVYLTSCRILVFIKNLAGQQNDVSEEIQGPPHHVFYNEKGEITDSGKKYLRSKDLTFRDITIKETTRGKYIFTVKTTKGRATNEIIPVMVNQFLRSLPLPKSMRWDNSDMQFLRPIRWLVCLYQGKVVKFNIGNITASSASYGHKFLFPGKIKVTTINKLKNDLKKSYVMVDPAERKKFIVTAIKKSISQDLTVDQDQGLLDEVSFMVEYPFVQLCEFEKKYLSIPSDFLSTSIKHHQHAFPVFKKNKLTHYFVVIVNNKPNPTIKNGNERVLRARLNDAKFFFEQDRKISLEKYNTRLKEILFLNDTGTMLDKVYRIRHISIQIGEMMNLSTEEKKNVERCAWLCKADLLTNIVYEFPELQGSAGRIYAELDKEKKGVSLGIEEHYRPRNVDDVLPKTSEGIIVALADRIDSIVGCFIKDLKPTGSQDPYQVRRSTLAVVNIILHYKLNLRIDKIIEKTLDQYIDQKLFEHSQNSVKK